MPSDDKGHELRCFCRRNPLLATYGVNDKGDLYVHVKIYKQSRIFGEILTTATVKLRCRECLRWHEVRITNQPGRAVLKENTEPLPFPTDDNPPMLADVPPYV